MSDRATSIAVWWWLQPVGLAAFGLVLALGFVSLRRAEVVGSRVRFAVVLGVGVVLLVVVAVALALTPRSSWP